ncbi:MAG: hypothetical protein WC841_05250 [Candidatus Shapirobacteria bacterium]|jgi:CheY-like chemotaxis protein
MSPSHAETYLIKRNPDQIEITRATLERNGHSVRETADSLEKALALIPRIPERAVVIVADNLGTSRRDGQAVASEIRKQIGNEVTIISHTKDGQPILRANYNSPERDGCQALADIVTQA